MFVLRKPKFKDFASGNNDDAETLQIEKRMGALQNGGVFQVEGTGDVRLRKAKFKDLASGNNDDVETLQFEKRMGALRNGGVIQVEGTGNVRFEESQIQRLTVTNPTACSIAYHRLI